MITGLGSIIVQGGGGGFRYRQTWSDQIPVWQGWCANRHALSVWRSIWVVPARRRMVPCLLSAGDHKRMGQSAIKQRGGWDNPPCTPEADGTIHREYVQKGPSASRKIRG